MNKSLIVGNLTRDVQYFKTQSGISYARFTVAETRKTKDSEITSFIPCIAWRQQADFLNQYAHKGDKVSIEGYITTGSYDDKTTGKKIYTFDVTVERVELIGRVQKTNNDESNGSKSNYVEDDGFDIGGPITIDPDDLPF